MIVLKIYISASDSQEDNNLVLADSFRFNPGVPGKAGGTWEPLELIKEPVNLMGGWKIF